MAPSDAWAEHLAGCAAATGVVWGFLVFALHVAPLIVDIMEPAVASLPGGPHGLGLILAAGIVLVLLAVFGGGGTSTTGAGDPDETGMDRRLDG